MGNVESLLGQTSLLIRTDRPSCSYAPGEFVTGAVLLNLQAPLQHPPKLYLVGYESTFWQEESTGGTERDPSSVSAAVGTGAAGQPHAGLHTFLSARLPLPAPPASGRSGGLIPAGQYCFPFAFQLPPGLPSSHEEGEAVGYHAHLRYELRARCGPRPGNGCGPSLHISHLCIPRPDSCIVMRIDA